MAPQRLAGVLHDLTQTEKEAYNQKQNTWSSEFYSHRFRDH